MHHRTNAVILSSIYLFTPMLFVAPTSQAVEFQHTNPLVTESLFELFGQGGPESDYPMNQPIEEQLQGILFPETVNDEQTVEVTITKTINYMRIANTTWPVDTPDVSSDYGWRTPPCDGCSSDHKGIDFVPGYGTPVYAVTDGMVIDMGKDGGYGNFIKLTHLVANSEGGVDEWVTLYAHLQTGSFQEELKVGSVVKTGDPLAAVGNTGISTGPHLHFELIINGEHVDPMPLLGTYEVVIIEEEDHLDWMFLGETFRTVEKEVSYE
jgi:murein DD-endopeptidase MepM/ murein hydrolase activator NlpD